MKTKVQLRFFVVMLMFLTVLILTGCDFFQNQTTTGFPLTIFSTQPTTASISTTTSLNAEITTAGTDTSTMLPTTTTIAAATTTAESTTVATTITSTTVPSTTQTTIPPTTTVPTTVTTTEIVTATMILNWNIAVEPGSIDPVISSDSGGKDIINHTFEGLVREQEGVIYPGIAQSWETSSDGLTITFHLRPSNWSDGSPLTASDFVYAWKRGMNPLADPLTPSASYYWQFSNIVGVMDALVNDGSLDDVGIVAVNDETLVVHLTEPTPYFVSLMAINFFMPVNQSSVESSNSWAVTPSLAVSNGPFKLTAYTAGTGVTLVKNENYWDKEHVSITQINGSFISDSTISYAAYLNGSLDVIDQIPTDMFSSISLENQEFHAFSMLISYYIKINMDLPEFENVKLRQALAYAIDRQAIVEMLGMGRIPSTGFLPDGFPDDEGNDFALTAGDFGIFPDDSGFDQAVTLFAEAATEMSMTVPELQAYLSGQNILYYSHQLWPVIAESIRDSWYNVLGIDLSLFSQEWTTAYTLFGLGEYDLGLVGWTYDFLSPSGFLDTLMSSHFLNDANYNNPLFDQLMTEAHEATDLSVYYDKLYQAYTLVMTDMPIIPIFHNIDYIMAKDYVTGWSRSNLGSIDFTRAIVTRN